MPGPSQLAGATAAGVFQPVSIPVASVLRPPDTLPMMPSAPPVPNLVSETVLKISRVAGFDQTVVTWSSSLDFSGYQFRVVSAGTDPQTAGVLIEQDQSPPSGGQAGVQFQSTLTDPEVEAVSPAEGVKLVKLFVRNANGWSA